MHDFTTTPSPKFYSCSFNYENWGSCRRSVILRNRKKQQGKEATWINWHLDRPQPLLMLFPLWISISFISVSEIAFTFVLESKSTCICSITNKLIFSLFFRLHLGKTFQGKEQAVEDYLWAFTLVTSVVNPCQPKQDLLVMCSDMRAIFLTAVLSAERVSWQHRTWRSTWPSTTLSLCHLPAKSVARGSGGKILPEAIKKIAPPRKI